MIDRSIDRALRPSVIRLVALRAPVPPRVDTLSRKRKPLGLKDLDIFWTRICVSHSANPVLEIPPPVKLSESPVSPKSRTFVHLGFLGPFEANGSIVAKYCQAEFGLVGPKFVVGLFFF